MTDNLHVAAQARDGEQATEPGEREGGQLRPAIVLVSVGTDKHPFDRLVEWMDEYQASLGEPSAGDMGRGEVTVQYGTSRPPVRASGSPLMPHADLQAAMGAATAVVTHGGPATIRDARSAGLLPLVVPRDPSRGEHVDDHQMRFARMLAEKGDIVLCSERDELTAALDRAIRDNSWLRLADVCRSEETAASIERVGVILDDVIRQQRRRPDRRRGARAVGRQRG